MNKFMKVIFKALIIHGMLVHLIQMNFLIDWLVMVDSLANYPKNVVDDNDSIDYVVYE